MSCFTTADYCDGPRELSASRDDMQWMPGGLWYAVEVRDHALRDQKGPFMLRFSWFRTGRKNLRNLRIKGPARLWVPGGEDRELQVTATAVLDIEPGLIGVLLDTNYHCLRAEDLKRDVTISYEIGTYNPLKALALAAD